MNHENKRSSNSFTQLGLPPMELAEPTAIDRKLQDCALIGKKVLIFMIFLVLTVGGHYLFKCYIYEDKSCSKASVIVVLPDAKNDDNLTREYIKKVYQRQNKSVLFSSNQRRKRSLHKRNFHSKRDKKVLNNAINDMNIIEARKIILNHDTPCTKENQDEVCKNLLKSLEQANNKDSQSSDIQNEELLMNPQNIVFNTKKEALDTDKSIDNTKSVSKSKLTPTDITKRQTESLELSQEPSQFNFQERVGNPYYVYPNQPLIHPHPVPSPSLVDTCLLAKLLHRNYPSIPGLYSNTPPLAYGYPPPLYDGYHTPGYHQPYYSHRETESRRRIITPEDTEIFKKYLSNAGTFIDSAEESFNDTSQQIANNFFNLMKSKPVKFLNSTTRDAQCPGEKVSCTNGECIENEMWCDGKVHCSDSSDETMCSCKSRVDRSRLCDGYFDCPFGEDEMSCFGCTETTFSCEDFDVNSQTTCFSKEQRCNNIADCPNRKDEMDCNMLSPDLRENPLFAVSNTQGFLQRNFKGDWYVVCKNPYMWAHDACRRETGLIIRPPFMQMLQLNPALKMQYINTGPDGMLHMTDHCFNSSSVFVTCPDLICGTRVLSTSQILKENNAAENHLFGRNKRFSVTNTQIPLIFFSNRMKRSITNETGMDNSVESKSKDAKRDKRRESRVVGGKPSQPAAWPWMAAMYRNGMFHCGAVVLTQSWTVSAAHCVHKFWEHYFEIQVGMLRRFSFAPQEQNHIVTHIIVNKQYDKVNMRNDLSLLKVKGAIEFSRWVRPICLPSAETAGPDWMWGPPAGTMCSAVGWGATVEHGPDPDHMREVEVPVWENCKHSEDQDGKEICAGLIEGGKDACQGDSGGPLLCRNPLNPQQWYMAGIVSHGDGCGRKDEPGVYTRVSLFANWIKSHIFSNTLPHLQPKHVCPGFKCFSGVAKCIPKKRICDKIIDCLDGEDEMNCETNTSLRTFGDNLFVDVFNIRDIETKTRETDPQIKNEQIIDNSSTSDILPESIADFSSSIQTNISENIMDNISPNTTFDNEDLIVIEDINSKFSKPKSKPNSTLITKLNTYNISNEQVTSDPFKEITNIATDNTLRGNNDVLVSISPSELEALSSPSEAKKNDDIQNELFKQSNAHESITEEDILDEFSTDITTEKINNDNEIKSNVTMKNLENTSDKSIVKELIKNILKTQPSKNLTEQNNEANDHLIIQLLPNTEVEQNENISTMSVPISKPIIDNDKSTNKNIHNITGSTPTTLPNFDIEKNLFDNIQDIIVSQQAKKRKKHRIPIEFDCRRIIQTIPYRLRCDHKADCEDGTDELGCNCIDYLITHNENLLCDGHFDCADGQDEMDCFTCPDNNFLCQRSQTCLESKYICDGKPQCPLGEDELNCYALTNGKDIMFNFDGSPQIMLEGYLTKKHENDWHVACEDNLSIEQQQQRADQMCRYLGFSSANRQLVKYINIKDDTLDNGLRKKRDSVKEGGVRFAYINDSKGDEPSQHILLRQVDAIKENCVPNITKVCMSLYVFCERSLFTEFESPNELLFARETEIGGNHTWPWIAKVYAEGEYKCTGVLIDFSWVIVSHSCLWDTLINHNFITVGLGSHRTLTLSNGYYEQIYRVDEKKELYRNKVVLLHLNKPAQYSTMVKPMVAQSSYLEEEKFSVCVAIGQDNNNITTGIFLKETSESCEIHNRCFIRQQKEPICTPGMVSNRLWAGIISCHTDQGWYPAASFVDTKGECGVGDRIVGNDIGNLKNDLKSEVASLKTNEEVYDNCDGQRCSRGRCVKLRQVCDGVRHCEDDKDESEHACAKKHNICTHDPFHNGCECTVGQLKCHNGKCVSKEVFKDGKDDCGDGTDEPGQTTCAHYLARVNPKALCDGLLHCHDRSDEDPLICKCFAKRSYKCRGSSYESEVCVAHDMVCDGIRDCPKGEDEATCVGLSAPVGTVVGTGEVIIRSHGVWHTKCYNSSSHTKSELEKICRELGFISGHAKQLERSVKLTSLPLTKVAVDNFDDIILNNKTKIKLRNKDSPMAQAVAHDNVENCYPVFIECL